MSAFKVTYPSGVEEIVVASDCDTIDQFANTKFGSVDYAEAGVKVKKLTDKQVTAYQRGLTEDTDGMAAEQAEELPVADNLHQLADEMVQEAQNAATADERAQMEKAAADLRAEADASK